jgi:hypothetical protein
LVRWSRSTSLNGDREAQGDLKSVVLHKLEMQSEVNQFPVAVGVRITGVDDRAFSSTGASYSHISLPESTNHTTRLLQQDEVALSYEFAAKFPVRTT